MHHYETGLITETRGRHPSYHANANHSWTGSDVSTHTALSRTHHFHRRSRHRNGYVVSPSDISPISFSLRITFASFSPITARWWVLRRVSIVTRSSPRILRSWWRRSRWRIVIISCIGKARRSPASHVETTRIRE